MKILHIITGMQKAAGTSVFCGEVCNGLAAMGHEVIIAVCNPCAKDLYQVDYRVKVVSIDSVLSERDSAAQTQFDIVHIHALWTPVLHRVAKWADKARIPIVWSPHGMLTPWAMNNKRWKKLAAWWIYQKHDLSKAALLHATAQSEVEDLRRLGLTNNIVVAPLGVDVPNCVEQVASVDGNKTLLFVSRVQKKKGLENLVRAWAKLGRVQDWKVRIVGPDQEGHSAELKQLCAELKVADDFAFVGPKYGEELQREYATADLFVLPTHSENFGSVVIEALAHSVPVICTKGAPWEELETHKCGWWIDIGVEPLVKVLQAAMVLPDTDRRAMGERGRKLVEEKYTWDAVVKTMEQAYTEVLNASA